MVVNKLITTTVAPHGKTITLCNAYKRMLKVRQTWFPVPRIFFIKSLKANDIFVIKNISKILKTIVLYGTDNDLFYSIFQSNRIFCKEMLKPTPYPLCRFFGHN